MLFWWTYLKNKIKELRKKQSQIKHQNPVGDSACFFKEINQKTSHQENKIK